MDLKFLFYTIFVFLLGCSAVPKVKILSAPEGALVTSRGSDGSNKSLGKTPLEVESYELSNSGGRVTSLVVSKEGFHDQHILLGRDRAKENYEIDIRLQGKTDDPKVMDAKSRQEKLAKNLVQSYNLMSAKRYEEARALLRIVVQEYPHISVGYDLLGTLSYLQKDLKSALNFYERSLQLNPENSETKLMIDRLKGMIQ
jgi:tetratricopeptide (TPR) repeat protein